jgi:hypothetical protein
MTSTDWVTMFRVEGFQVGAVGMVNQAMTA